MPTKYLLPCECGENIPVEASRSGERVKCECGHSQEIPPLRVLKTLEVQPARKHPSDEPTGWSRRGARVLVCSIFTIAMLIFSAYIYQTRPRPIEISKMTPSGTWGLWMYYRNRVSYQSSKQELKEVALIKSYNQQIKICLGLTALGILGILLSLVLTRNEKPKRKLRRRKAPPPES